MAVTSMMRSSCSVDEEEVEHIGEGEVGISGCDQFKSNTDLLPRWSSCVLGKNFTELTCKIHRTVSRCAALVRDQSNMIETTYSNSIWETAIKWLHNFNPGVLSLQGQQTNLWQALAEVHMVVKLFSVSQEIVNKDTIYTRSSPCGSINHAHTLTHW